MPEQHWKISPSQLSRWLECHAAFTEEQKYPDQPGGPAAVDGTHTHTLVEACIKDGLMDAMFKVGEEMEDHEGKFVVDIERATRANVAIHYVQRRKQELGVCAIRAEQPSNPGSHVNWDDWVGTADITIVGDDELEVVDYKDGRTPQDPVFNPQLMSYALGRMVEYQWKYHTIRMTIIQPRCNPPISHHDVTAQDLKDFADKVVEWRKIAEGPNPEFNPGEKQCRWCNARSGCKALMNHSLTGAGISFPDLEVAQQAADKDPNTMSDQELREFIEAIPLLKQAITAVEEEALRRFNAGHTIDGLKPVRGRGSRGWAFEDDEMAEKLKRMGIPKAALYTSKLVSPAQVEKLSWEKRDGSRKQLSKRQLDTLEKEYIKKSPGKITIVSESDDRPAVELGAAKLFGSVEPETKEYPDWLN